VKLHLTSSSKNGFLAISSSLIIPKSTPLSGVMNFLRLLVRPPYIPFKNFSTSFSSFPISLSITPSSLPNCSWYPKFGSLPSAKVLVDVYVLEVAL
jgi:hypothetical protein